MIRTIAMVVIVCLSITSVASAHLFYQDYLDRKDNVEFNVYLIGLLEGLTWANASLQYAGSPRFYCPPDSLQTTVAVAKQAIETEAKRNPDSKLPIGLMMLTGLKILFPCK